MKSVATYANGCLNEKILRELASYDIRCPEIAVFTRMQGRNYVVTSDLSSFHWSRQYEFTWAVLESNLTPVDCVLDAGGGYSVLQYALAKRCKNVKILDPNKDYLKIAEKTAKTLEISNIELINETIENYQNPHQFDKIFCISVLEHIKEKELRMMCIEKLIKMLKPDGQLFFTFDVVMKAGNEIYDFYVDRYEAVEILAKLKADMPPDDQITVGSFPNGCILAAMCVKVEL